MDQRRRVVKLIKTLQPRASNRQIAKTLGVSKDTVRRDTGANAPPPAKNPNENNHAKHTTGANAPPGLSGAEVVRLAQRQAAKTEFRGPRRAAAWRLPQRRACRNVKSHDTTPLARICSRVDYVKRTVGSYRLAQCTRASLLIVRVPRGVDPKHAPVLAHGVLP